MSKLSDCLHKGTGTLFKKQEALSILGDAITYRKTNPKIDADAADLAFAQSLLDEAIAERQNLSDQIYLAMGKEPPVAEASGANEDPRSGTPEAESKASATEEEGRAAAQGEAKASDIAEMSADDFDALVNEVEKEQNPAAALFSGRGGKLPDANKSAGKIAGEAARHAITAVGKGFAGLDALFGRKGTLGSGLQFDEETWAKAKPLFKEAFDEFVAAGNSAKEFVRHVIGRYGSGVVPYLKKWQAEMSAPQKAAKEPKHTSEPKVEKLQDTGEKMAGKRSDKITKDLRDNATGNKKKDLQKILDMASKSTVWKIAPSESATSGTKVYLERVRDSIKSFLEYAGENAGGTRRHWGDSFSEALSKHVERSAENLTEVEKLAGEYIAIIEQLAEGTRGAMTVEQARAALEGIIVEKVIKQDSYTPYAEGSDTHSSEWSAGDGGKNVHAFTFYTDTGKQLNKYTKSLSRLYDVKYGIPSEVKDDASRSRAKPMVRPKLENIVRVDMKDHRNGKDVNGKDFIDAFGFRGVEFGEWVNSKERQVNVNLAFDAFYDLADTLGIEPKGLSLGGTLGMAFGSRGQGKASAHYEPTNVVINLTKTRGDGTVAHEWGHAFDYALRSAEGANAVNDLKSSLKKTYDTAYAIATVDRLLSGQTSVRGQTSRGALEMAKNFITGRYWANASWGVVKTTEYKKEADKLGKEYWGNDNELFARAFEAYVYDTMAGESPYLVTDWVADSTVTKDGGYKGRPYPTSEERGRFNSFFGHFMENVEWKDGAPSMKEGYIGTSAEQLKSMKDTLDALLPTLEERMKQLQTGTAKSDGLFWYKFDYGMRRGTGLQPKGYFAFDDTQFEVGYPSGLDPSDLREFGLKSVSDHWQPGENVVYINKEASDDARERKPDDLGSDSESPLGGISPEDGGSTETGGGVPRRPAERTGNGETGGGELRAPGDGTKQRPTGGDEDVPIPSERTGTTDLGSGQDAVRPTGTNYRITAADHLGEGSIEVKFNDNIAAITTIKKIESENRLATPEEQKILVRYVGWGGMPQAFNYHEQEGWRERTKQLAALLTEAEYEAARASTTNAHYTAPKIVSAMWDAVRRLGFTGGRTLEPGVGSGNFFGLMPDDLMHASKLTGVELDSLTARIAKQLYQQANIVNKGYQDATYPQGFFDLTISNVPFSEADHPVDKKYNKERLNLHDYYFRKSIELTRPGGLIAFITSKGTMDKLDTKARALFADKADFLGAIRLPQDAFSENANTTVTTDIIFLRRKVEGVKFEGQPWLNTAKMDLPEAGSENKFDTTALPVNEYFATPEGKEMLLGNMVMRRGRYGGTPEVALESDGRDIGKAISEAIVNLPENVVVETSRVEELEHEALLIPAEGVAKDGGYLEKEGKLYKREGEMMSVVAEGTAREKTEGGIIRSSLKLRDSIRALLQARVNDLPEDQVKALKDAIDNIYKAFVKKHGYLNSKENTEAFTEDPDSALLLAIEKWDAEDEKGKRIDIDFQKRKPVEHTDNALDALTVSLNEKGRVDWPTITRLTGMPEELAQDELKGSVYDDPEQGWVMAEEYLSGNVREKLRIAKAAAEADKKFSDNVAALEAALPVDLPPSKITVRAGAPWIPGDDVSSFMEEMLGVRAGKIKVNFLPEIGKWVISAKSGGYKSSEAADVRAMKELNTSTEATVTHGTRYVPFMDLMEFALNGGFPVVKYPKDNDGKQEVNRKATAEANAKLQGVKESFSKWIWGEAERSERLHRKYNDEMNGVRLREYKYPASADQINARGHIRLNGMAVGMALLPHQAGAVWRTVVSGNTYYAHEVGTGKTFTMVSAAMEMKRLGIARKPMIAVMNSTIGQIKAEFLRLYPGANVLSMNISENKVQRKLQLARIALNDWDAVIVTHDSFSRIPMSDATIRSNFQREIDNLTDAILESKADNMSSRVVKELEKSKKALENKMKLALDKREKDNVISFEELGVDQIFVDEAQEFKNLMFSTRMGRQMRGLNPEGSGRAFDMFMKTNWLNENFGRGVVMASGTPISNSVGELFSISRYLQPTELKKRGIQMFDPWANTFGDIGQVAEYLPEGGGYQMVTKFNRFVNIPELMQMVYGVMDSVSADKAGVVRPAISGGKHEAVLVPQNEGVKAYMEVLKDRALNIRQNPKEALPDNMLVVCSDGRKAATDMRMIYPKAPDYEQTKTNEAVSRIIKIHKQEQSKLGVQLVFSDLGVPGADFSVYEDLKKKLIKNGIPASEIAFVHDAKNDRERKSLFAKVNAGRIRVFIGSTKKAGTGVNIQERVAAIHNLDTHWNLANLLQRIGRGHRQGNIYKEIQVLNYATEKTVDAFMWDKVQSKGRFVDQIMSGDVTLREAEDISQETMSSAEMVAIASGDPMIAEKVNLEASVQKLSLEAAAFADTLYEVRLAIARTPERVSAHKKVIEISKKELWAIEKLDTVMLGEKPYKLDDPKVREELNKAVAALVDSNEQRVLADVHANDKREKNAKQDIVTDSLMGYITGEKVKYPLYARRGLVNNYVNITTPAGNRGWDATTQIGRGLAQITRDFEKSVEEANSEIELLEGELPKLKNEAANKFSKQAELDKKRTRLEEIESALTKREDSSVATDADTNSDLSRYRYILKDEGLVAIAKFEDVSLDEFPGVGFFLHSNKENASTKFTLSHADSGLAFMRGDSKAEILNATKNLIELRGADKIRELMEARDKITDEQKQESLMEAKFSQSTTPANNPHTLSTLAAAIDKAMGSGFTKLLEATGKFHLITNADIPADVSGAYFSKTTDQTVYWHGSASGDLRGGRSGLHLGTKEAARQALEARIGIPAEGEWDGTREYGKTLLAGKKTQLRLNALEGRNINTGQNSDAPYEDYYPEKGKQKYADGTEMPMDVKPNILPYTLNTEMTNSRYAPLGDTRANASMAGQLKKGTAKRGYYYENTGEDVGSISVVVPNGDHVDIRYSKSGRILAFVIGGQTYLVADNISQTDDNVKGLLMHEISVHALKLGKTDAEFQKILTQIDTMRKMGNAKVMAAHEAAKGSAEEYVKSKIADVDARFMVAWHGSPHDHDKFDSSKIGTGEGAQEYGYGLYFAEAREVAEYYQKNLSQFSRIDGKPLAGNKTISSGARTYLLAENADLPKAIQNARDAIARKPDNELLPPILKELESLNPDSITKSSAGQLYQVELAPATEDYLLWDKPLSEQSEKVKAALRKKEAQSVLADAGIGFEAFKQDGNNLYNRIALHFASDKMAGDAKGDKAASEYLHSIGIRGIKYLDGSSRSKGEGNYNYVIFRDEDVSITAKFAVSGRSAEQSAEYAKLREEIIKTEGYNEVMREETAAYLIQHHPDLTISQKLIAWFRAAIRKLGKALPGMQRMQWFKAINALTVEDVVYMAQQALKSAPQTLGKAKDRGTFKAESPFDGKEVATTPMDKSRKTITVDGVERPAQNSNGQPIHWSEEGTRNFWRHFGDSVVVDEDGKPQIMRHGSVSEFHTFDKSKIRPNDYDAPFNGFWFTTDDFASPASANPKHTIEAYLSIQNPASHKEWRAAGKEARDRVPEFEARGARSAGDATRMLLQDRGYDGVLWEEMPKIDESILEKNGSVAFQTARGITYELRKNKEDDSLDLYDRHGQEITGGYIDVADYIRTHGEIVAVVFEPSQIKSATGNAGSFSPTNPDIRFSKSSGQPTPIKDRASSLVDTLIYNFQDMFLDLKRKQKFAPPKSEASDPYLAQELQSGTVRAQTDDFTDDRVKPLQKLIHESKLDIDVIQQFLWAKHAPSRNAVMKERNPTKEELEGMRQDLTDTRQRLSAVQSVSEYRKLQRDLADAKLSLAEGEVGEKAIYVIEREMLDLRRDNKEVKEYLAAIEKGKALGRIQPYIGDNTALSGMSNAEAKGIIANAKADGSFDKMEEISQKVYQITKETKQLMLDSGLITQGEFDAWDGLWENYVPLHRDEVGDDIPRIGQGLNVRGKESKHATGSEKEATNILAHVMAKHEATIIRANKVKVDRALASYIAENPEPDFWTLDTIPMVDDLDAATGMVVRRVDPSYKNRDNVLTYKVDGVEHTIEFNEKDQQAMRLVAAMKNMSAQQLGEVTQTIGKFTRLLATMNTSANPVFLVRNFLRDLQGAYINLSDTAIADMKGEVFSNIMPAMRGMWDSARGNTKSEWAKNARRFRDAGGQVGWMEHYDTIHDRAAEFTKEIERMWPGKKKMAVRVARNWWNTIEDANQAVENSVRLSAFMAAIKAGKSDSEAASIAKNLTVNFNRKGMRSAEFNMWYMFMNASIQGTTRMVQAMKNKEVQKIVGFVVASGFLMDVLARAMAGDDDDDGENDYDQIKPHVKQNNWVFWVGGRPVTVPMPYGYNFFHNVGRSLSEALFRKDYSPGKSAANLAITAFEAFSPTGQASSFGQLVAPTIVDPYLQWSDNKNFAGIPLRREQSPFGSPKPEYQMGLKSTSEPAKLLAEYANELSGGNQIRPGLLNFNPAAFDFAVSSILGGAGRTYLQAFNGPIKMMAGEEVKTREVPFVNIFLSAMPEYQSERKFYDNLRSIEVTRKEIALYRDDKEMMNEIRKERGHEIKVSGFAKIIEREVSKINDREREIQKANPPNKRELLKKLEERKVLMMNNFNKKYHEAMR